MENWNRERRGDPTGRGEGRGETGKTSSRVVWRVTTGRTGTGSGVVTRLGEGRGDTGTFLCTQTSEGKGKGKLTCVPRPSVISMLKKRIAQRGEMGRRDTTSG